MTTVDHPLMRGFEPHDRWYVAELPRSRSRSQHRIGDPAYSGREGSPDRDRASGLAKLVEGFAGASLGWDPAAFSISPPGSSPAGRWPRGSPPARGRACV
jgi:hypothetical protein